MISDINKTKCIKQCKLDETKQYCIACKRSIQEIINAGKKYENNK